MHVLFVFVFDHLCVDIVLKLKIAPKIEVTERDRTEQKVEEKGVFYPNRRKKENRIHARKRA